MQTQDSTPREASKHADGRSLRYDTDLIKSEGEPLLASYLGRPGKPSGARALWTCPRCGKDGKLALQRATGAVGCWNAACEVPDTTDVLGLIAHLESLQTRGEDFKKVAALCYELLGIPDPDGSDNPYDGAEASSEQDTTPLQTGTPEGRSESRPASRRAHPETTGQVLGRLLELCPLEERDERLLASRGVALATAHAGRFGSISADRAAYVVGCLEREFGREMLLDVPGFREDARNGGRLGFTLWGDFILIPYLDAQGRVTTIEGMAVGTIPDWAGKYTSLRGGGNHLYVFPGFRPEDLLAICEGPMGVVIAAQEGIPVGAIQGVKRYKAAGEDAPLPELAGVDFGGRGVLYVADADVKPEAIADVEKHAPRACEWLITRQNGVPRIATVPEEIPGIKARPKDLDEWMLAAPEVGYQGIIRTLFSRSAAPEKWSGVNHAEEAESRSEHGEPAPESVPSEHPADMSSQVFDAEDDEDLVGDRADPDCARQEEATEEESLAAAPDPMDAIDRWHAVVEGCQGDEALVAGPNPYRTGLPVDETLPSGQRMQDRELEWAGLLGLGFTLALWYFLGACIGWLPGPFGWLPDPPGFVSTLGGIPVSLAFGFLAGIVVLLHLSGRRLTERSHLLGQRLRR